MDWTIAKESELLRRPWAVGKAHGGGAITALAAARIDDRRVARNLMAAAAVLFAVLGAVTMSFGTVIWDGAVRSRR